jgi:hypothetical protein
LQAARVRTATMPIAASGNVELLRLRARLTRGPAFPWWVVNRCACDTGNPQGPPVRFHRGQREYGPPASRPTGGVASG